MGNENLLMGYKNMVYSFIEFMSYIGQFDSFYFKIGVDIYEKTTVQQDEEIIAYQNKYTDSIIKTLAEEIHPELANILPKYMKYGMRSIEKDYEITKRKYRDYYELDYEIQSCESNEYWRDRIEHDWSDQDTD